ncbi:PIG-L family deacetylase [Nocardioides panacis]|uniref:PIG-L family deacetylase n=1 Tax=Nocardioides panacis TaxID=2849501 RepID=A0A975T1M2_9ACTN|nr:PIG-L family deacetylase [Nocardioides panacis]QWZ09988.1 PIG-L family deacetylase [Nocardioides panacis]
MSPDPRTFTLVSFHAHPDDETLLTGGLLARAARDGHRVVLVTATDGERGLAGAADGAGPALASTRGDELDAAARALGVHRVVRFGLPDSGLHPDPADTDCFAHRDVEDVAALLVQVLDEEHADVLTIYDAQGGYGHPDHVQVHRAGTRAAGLAGTPVVLEATLPGRGFRGLLRALHLVGHPLGRSAPYGTAGVFADPHTITHRVRVGAVARDKRAAMAAHSSQRRGPGPRRLIDHLAALPLPVFAALLGHEWYVEQGRPAPDRVGDVFASLRARTPSARP